MLQIKSNISKNSHENSTESNININNNIKIYKIFSYILKQI